MDAAELRATQAPIKDRYKTDPKTAMITLKAKGSIENEGIACKVETGRALAVAGLHPATGGSGLELCSGDMLLEALVACAGVTLKSVATAIKVPLKTGIVIAEGEDVLVPTPSRYAHLAVIDVLATGLAQRLGANAREALRRVRYTVATIGIAIPSPSTDPTPLMQGLKPQE